MISDETNWTHRQVQSVIHHKMLNNISFTLLFVTNSLLVQHVGPMLCVCVHDVMVGYMNINLKHKYAAEIVDMHHAHPRRCILVCIIYHLLGFYAVNSIHPSHKHITRNKICHKEGWQLCL